MFDPRFNIYQKAGLLVAACLLAGGVSWSAEPATNSVQKASSENAPRVLEQTTASKIFRPYLPSNPFSESANVNIQPATPMVAPQNPASSSKRQSELLDRERNWIFARPETKDKSSTVEEAIGGGILGDKASKGGLINQFLTQGRENISKVPGEKELELNPLSLQPNSLQPNSIFGDDRRDRNRLQEKGSSVDQGKFSEMYRERYGASGVQAREKREADMRDFENLFRPSSIPAPVGNGQNLLGQNGFGVKTVTSSRGVPDRFNPAAASSSSDTLRAAARGVSGFGASEKPGINSRVFGESAVAPKVEVKRQERQPAALPFPKRKF